MKREKFEELVAKTLSDLPAEFRDRLENIDVVVLDYPTHRQAARAGHGRILLGLYEGVPRTRRTRGYNMVLPDKIIIFRRAIEARCQTEPEIALEIQRVVRHEIAHHFGLDDELLGRIEAETLRGGGMEAKP